MNLLATLRLAERLILVSLLSAMVALYFLGIVTREIGGTFASRFAWIEEATRLMNVFLVFLGLGLALERGRHVSIDSLRARIGARWAGWIGRLVDLVGLATSLYIAWLALGLVQFVLQTRQASPTLGIPMGYVYLAPLAGFLLLALRYGLRLTGLLPQVAPGAGQGGH